MLQSRKGANLYPCNAPTTISVLLPGNSANISPRKDPATMFICVSIKKRVNILLQQQCFSVSLSRDGANVSPWKAPLAKFICVTSKKFFQCISLQSFLNSVLLCHHQEMVLTYLLARLQQQYMSMSL